MKATTVALSLISHTNAGKTTLARTLLGRDIGEVRDAPHVTTEASAHVLTQSETGDILVLWDTPGFGDSARLARRLAQQGNPIGWFLTQIWDRFRDRAFHHAQLAVRNVRDEADVVLYLLNAAEAPADAGYLGPELEVLAWIDRPVFVLLNQTGPPRPRAEEQAEEARWREALGQRHYVHGVLALDAFARCWVQEEVLLRAIAPSIVPAKREGYDRLVAAWQRKRLAQFDEAIAALAVPIAGAATDRVALASAAFRDKVLDALRSVVGRPADDPDRRRAAQTLAERLDAGVRGATDRLIAIHGLEGSAAETVRERLADRVRTDAPVDEGKAAMMGGVVSGALSGLAADLAAGGLTLGAGTLIGAIAGALGGAGLARGYNVLSGRTESAVRWDDEVLDTLVASALLTYLAVAHFGRGRGEWRESEYPPFWQDVVQREVVARRAALAAIWAKRDTAEAAESIERELRPLLREAARAVLDDLYPGALAAQPQAAR
jgi:outer membrane lipoprotein SlyB